MIISPIILRGGTVILDGDFVINFPKAEISVTKNDTFKDGKYLYLSLVKIKKLDVLYLTVFEVIGFELNIFKGEINNPDLFMKEVRCLQ